MPEGDRSPAFKVIGICLAVASGLFIGVSFVLKKKGLLAANLKEGQAAGEGYGYLKNAFWWTGMTLMILGEICNFAAYMFVDAILVTPLGALSVVITAILSSMFLNERLSFIGKIGCFLCILGSVVIVMNAPQQDSVSTIQEMQHYVISPGFLSFTGVIIVGCIVVVLWVAPRWGHKSMLVYLSVCSTIGGLSVVAIQGLGAAIITQAQGTPQFNQWFLYVLLVFIVGTLVTEIIYLNKALNIFNTALVTPTYYVIFTSATIVTSAVLFRGFKGTPTAIATVVMGFLEICAGVVLLQLSKSAKDVPDTEVFRGDLAQVRTVAEQSEPESEPRADTIRGTAAIIRRISVARRTAEQEEARRVREDRLRDLNSGSHDGESIEWDGVRRRTITFRGDVDGQRRRGTLDSTRSGPQLGRPRIPDIEEGVEDSSGARRRSMSVDEAMRQQVYSDLPEDEHPEGFLGRVKGLFIPKQRSKASLRDSEDVTNVAMPHRDFRDASGPGRSNAPRLPDYEPYGQQTGKSKSNSQIPLQSPTEMKAIDFAAPKRGFSGNSEYEPIPLSSNISSGHFETTSSGSGSKSGGSSLRPDSRASAKRQFSFQNILHHGHHRPRSSSSGYGADGILEKTRRKRAGSHAPPLTEEEMLGLVKGDSSAGSREDSEEDDDSTGKNRVRITEGRSEDDDSDLENWREKEWESRTSAKNKK